ncbi:MAG: MFS transporter [Spirochaetia bacterium]|nr:MFS transporter [Spirochaetia bacterium]
MAFQKSSKHTGKTMSLLLLMSLTVAAGVYRNGFPAMFPFIHAEFGLSRTVMGLYISFLYLVSAALAIFAGWFADRLGAKKGILIGMGSLTVLIFAHIFAPSFSVILVLAALCGIGFSIVSPGATKGVTDLFSPARRGTAMGILFMGWSIGGLAGSAFLPVVAQYFGWRSATVVMGGYMLITITLFQLYFKESTGEQSTAATPSPEKFRLKEGFRLLLDNKKLHILCLRAFVLGSVSGTLAAHYTLFVHLDYGYSMVLSGIGFAFLNAGSVLGRPAWGLINDRLLRGREDIGFLLINLMNALVFALFVLFYRFTEVPAVWIILAATFIAGFSTRGWPGVFFAAVSRDADRGNTGMSAGLALVFVRLGITLSPPVFGFIADITGSYEYSWILMALFALISGVGFFVKKNTTNSES